MERLRGALPLTALAAAASVLAAAGGARGQTGMKKDWAIHDETRPMARVVDPGLPSTPDRVGTPPSDAVVLFDGKDLAKWRTDKDGSPARWKVAGGYVEVAAGTGDIRTEQGFGDCQLHVE